MPFKLTDEERKTLTNKLHIWANAWEQVRGEESGRRMTLGIMYEQSQFQQVIELIESFATEYGTDLLEKAASNEYFNTCEDDEPCESTAEILDNTTHQQNLITKDRDGNPIPLTYAHCDKPEVYCRGVVNHYTEQEMDKAIHEARGQNLHTDWTTNF